MAGVTVIACSTASLGSDSGPESLGRIAAAGFGRVELAISDGSLAPEAIARPWLAAAAAHRLEVVSVDATGLAGAESCSLSWALEVARCLGARMLVVPCPPAVSSGRAEAARALLERLAAHAADARRDGVQIALAAPRRGTLVGDLAEQRDFVGALARRRTVLACDTAEIAAIGLPVNELWWSLAARIAHLHVGAFDPAALAAWARAARIYGYPGLWVMRAPAAAGALAAARVALEEALA